MNCLVTGGAGFIGSVLVDSLLENGNTVTVIDNESAEQNEKFYWNKKANNFKNDICNYKNIEGLFENVDWVFHLAAQSRIQPSIINPTETLRANCYGTENILRASRKHKVNKIIYSSSSSIYGLKNNLPHKENMDSDCLNPYAISKATSEDLCKMYNNLYGLQVVILRYFNVYGDRQPTKGEYAPIIGRFLKLKSKKEALTIVGDGSQKRDYTHVEDIVDANILAAKNKKIGNAEIINIGSGKNYSVLELINIINAKSKYVNKRQGEAYETLADITKAKNVLKWQPRIDVKEWLKKKCN